jgi:hypothetical protein
VKAGPRPSDWLLLLCTLVFTAVSVALLAAGRGGRGVIATLALFGFGTAVATWILLEKARMARSTRVTRIEIAGGVPIRARRVFRWIAGAALLVVGSVMTWAGGELGALFQGLSALIAVTGGVLLVLVATGRVANQTLTFERDGIRFGGFGARNGSFMVHWTNLAHVDVVDFHGNGAVRIRLADVQELVRTARAMDAARMVAKNRAWLDCDVFLLPYHFGMDAVLFAKAVSAYAADPVRREELDARSLLRA